MKSGDGLEKVMSRKSKMRKGPQREREREREREIKRQRDR